MASVKPKRTKDGKLYYEIRVRRGRGQSEVSTRWYPPVGKSLSTIERMANKYAAEFELKVEQKLVVSAHEQKELDRKREAEAAAEAARIQTVEQFAKVFMQRVEAHNSEATRQNYQSLLDTNILPTIGKLPVQEVGTAHIVALMDKLLLEGKKVSTRQRTWAVLKLMLSRAKATGLISVNPMSDMADFRPTATKADKAAAEEKREAFFTGEEVNNILTAVDSEPLKWRCFIYLLALTGCRRGEGLGLRWSDVNLKERTITFRGSLNYTAKHGVYWGPTKSGKTRTADLSADKSSINKLFELLKELQEVERFTEKALQRDKDDSEKQNLKNGGWVFRQDNSLEPMHPTSPTKYFAKFGERHGIQDFHPHALRHAFGSISARNGVDIVSISRALGHADSRITQATYLHASDDSSRRATCAVASALDDPKTAKEAVAK